MSYVFRKIKKYTINLLEVFAFSSYYNWVSIAILALTWTNFFGVATVYINSFIILSWIFGWWYETYKLTKENQFLRNVNTSLSNYEAEDVREALATLMHDFWAEDIFKIDLIIDERYKANLDYIDLILDEQYRANLHYIDLSDDDKQVNLAKADRVLQLINSCKKDNNNNV